MFAQRAGGARSLRAAMRAAAHPPAKTYRLTFTALLGLIAGAAAGLVTCAMWGAI